MPRGLKQTSDLIAVSGSLTESAANTFTQGQTDLALDALNNEVFVVTAIDIQTSSPDLDATGNSAVTAALSTTSRTSVGSLADVNTMARLTKSIRVDVGVPLAVPFIENSTETPAAQDQEWVAIIATSNFFAQIIGENNGAAKTMQFRVWGYRAQASASTYAALVQSEVLSA